MSSERYLDKDIRLALNSLTQQVQLLLSLTTNTHKKPQNTGFRPEQIDSENCYPTFTDSYSPNFANGF